MGLEADYPRRSSRRPTGGDGRQGVGASSAAVSRRLSVLMIAVAVCAGCRREEAVVVEEEAHEEVVAVAVGPPMEAVSMEMPAADLATARWEPHYGTPADPTPHDPAPGTVASARPTPDGDSAGEPVAADPPADVPGTLYLTGSLQYLTEPEARPVTETFAAVAIRDAAGDLADPDRPIMGVMDVGHLVAGPEVNRWVHEAARELMSKGGAGARAGGVAAGQAASGGDVSTPWRVTLPVGRMPQGDTLWLRLGFLEVSAEAVETATFPLPAIGETVAVSPGLALVRAGDEVRQGSLEVVFEVRRDPPMLSENTVRVHAEPVTVRIVNPPAAGDAPAAEPTPESQPPAAAPAAPADTAAPRPASRLSGWRTEPHRPAAVVLSIPSGTDLRGTALEVTWARGLTLRVNRLTERRLTLDNLIVPMPLPPGQ